MDAPLHAVVSDLAEKVQRAPEEITSDLLAVGLAQRQTHEALVRRWESLSIQEQEVVLSCLGYTNCQIPAIIWLESG